MHFDEIDEAVTSEVTRVECLRIIDRIRIQTQINDELVATYSESIHNLLSGCHIVLLTSRILDRAAQPFPTLLGTLDAIHMASALAWQQAPGREIPLFLTHDMELGRAARALGFTVGGC